MDAPPVDALRYRPHIRDMEPLATIPEIDGVTRAGAGERVLTASEDDGDRSTRTSAAARSQRRPGMGFGHDVLLALIMAVVMTATVLLYR